MSLRGSFSYKEAAGVLVAMSLCLPAAFAAEKSFDLTLSVNGPVTLRVSTGSGYIRVSQGSDNQVHIVGHVKGNSWWGGGSAEDAVSRVADHPPIDQAGNIVRVGDEHAAISSAMRRLITRSQRRPIRCWWRRLDPATCSFQTSTGQRGRTRGRGLSMLRSWVPAPDWRLVLEASTRMV